jgi:cytochrome c biogenesis protein CcmG, thiol:disulfide interchange protein DsbE
VSADAGPTPATEPSDQPAAGGSRTILWVTLAVTVVVAGLVGALQFGGDSADQVSDIVGDPVPSVQSETLDGLPFDLDSMIDGQRWVLVSFFATWCGPCLDDHPEFLEFARRHEVADDARVVSVVFNERVDNVAEFFAENGGDWPVVRDPDGAIAVDFAVLTVPETFLITPDGFVVQLIRGGVTADGLDQLIAQADEALYGGTS